MNVSAEALFDLATASGAPLSLRSEGVVRWATGRLAEQNKALQALSGEQQKQLREAAARALRALTDPEDHQYHEAVAMLRAALKGTT